MRLAEALEQTATGVLRRVASAHGLPHDASTTRDELITRILERLGDGSYVEEQVRALSEDERGALASARASAGELRGFLVDLDHPGAADALAERGWLYRVFAAAGPLRGEVFVVPDEFLSVLRPETEELAAPSATEPAPLERRTSDPAFNVFALVSALSRSGGHLESEVRSWSAEPGSWAWDARWSFIQQLILGAGLLIHRADGKLAAAASLPRLLDEPATLSGRLWRAYLADRGWSELTHAGLHDDPELVDTLGLRRAVTSAVDQLAENSWVGLEQFSEWLQRTRPVLVREQLTPRGVVLFQAMDWADLEYPLLRAFVLGPLYWLGCVALNRDGRTFARRTRWTAPPFEACTWEGSTELLAPARARLGTLLRAEPYLVLRERGRMSRYHLVQAHVAAALGTGGSLAEGRQLLVQLSQAPLPQAVDERLTAWERRFGALEIRPAVIVESRVAGELDEAIVDERVRGFIRSRLGSDVAEVAAADALELAAALRDSGHLPRIDAALRLAAEPRQAYAGLVDEQVLEFLLVSLLAFQTAWPERLAELEGSAALLERLEHQFPPERLAALRADAARLAGALTTTSAPRAKRRRTTRRRRKLP